MPTTLKDHNPIRSRSPYFINCVPQTGETIISADLTVTIQTGSRADGGSNTDLKEYVVSKTNAVDGIIVFDIAPLVSDYLDHVYDSNIRVVEFEISDVLYMSETGSGQYMTVEVDTTEFCDIQVGDKMWVKTPAFVDCAMSWIETNWLTTVTEVTETDITVDVGDEAARKNKVVCLSTTSAVLSYAAQFVLDTHAEPKEVVFVKVEKDVEDSGGTTSTEEYYTANAGYSRFKDGVNYLPLTNATGNYNGGGGDDWSPVVAKGQDVTIMATNCYRQMGRNSYCVLPIFTGQFDYREPNMMSVGRIKFGAGEDWKTTYSVGNIRNQKIIPSDAAQYQVEYSVTYIGLGKKNMCDNWIDTKDYLRVGHFLISSEVSGTSGEVQSVNDQDVLRYEIICEPKYDVIDCLFINRFGFWDSFSFLKKSSESIETSESMYSKQLGYVSNEAYTYNINAHQKQRYNVNGNRSIRVNTGFVADSFNLLLEEILLSESIYLIIDDVFTPVTIKTNAIDLKKSVNDKLINYELAFECAYNSINTII